MADDKDEQQVIVAFGMRDGLHGQVKWAEYPNGIRVYYDDTLEGFRDAPLEDITLHGVGSVDVLVIEGEDGVLKYCPHVNCRRVC